MRSKAAVSRCQFRFRLPLLARPAVLFLNSTKRPLGKPAVAPFAVNFSECDPQISQMTQIGNEE
jgi:hypothetical protein